MEVITIESSAFKEIIDQIKDLRKEINQSQPPTPLKDVYLDNEEASKLLRVTKRTMQNYRDQKMIPFIQVGNKIYYSATDIQKHLDDHYIQARRV